MSFRLKKFYLKGMTGVALAVFGALRILSPRYAWKVQRLPAYIPPLLQRAPLRPGSIRELEQACAFWERRRGKACNCLTRSLALYSVSKLYGLAVFVRLGCIKDASGQRSAHAWVESITGPHSQRDKNLVQAVFDRPLF